ncbi:T9SS type A sorting domain-containing protein [Rufibacter soli]
MRNNWIACKGKKGFGAWMLVWAFSIFWYSPLQAQTSYQPGDYRTASSGSISQQEGTSLLEQFTSQGTWVAASYPVPSSGTLYIIHATQLAGNLQLSTIQVSTQQILTIPAGAKLTIATKLAVAPFAEVALTGEVENKGLLQLQSSSKLTIKSPSYQASNLLWAGTEDIDATSELRIEAAVPNSLLFSAGQLSLQTHGYWFGRVSFAPTVANTTWKLTDSSAPLAADAFSVVLPASSSLLLLDGPSLSLSVGKDITLTGGTYFLQNQASGTASLLVPVQLTLQNSTFTLNQTSSSAAVTTVDLKGNLVTDATSAINNISNTSGSGLRFIGNTWQTLQAVGAISHVSLTIKPAAMVKLGQHLILNPSNSTNVGTFTVENGATLDFSADANNNAYQVQGQGYFKLDQGGTLYITSAQGINATGAIGNVVVTDSRRTFNQLATFVFNGKVPQQTGNAFPSVASGKVVIIDNPTSVTVTSSFGVSTNATISPDGGRLEIKQGEFIATPTADVTGGGKLVMTGGTYKIAALTTVPQLTGAYDLTGGAIELTGTGAQTLRGKIYPTIIIGGSNTPGVNSKTISTTTTINQNLTILPNAILDISNKTLKGDGGLTMTGGLFRTNKTTTSVPELTGIAKPYQLTGGTVEFYGSVNGQSQSIRGTYGTNAQKLTYHHVLLTATEANTLNESGNHMLSASFDVTGTLTVMAPAVLQMASNRSVGGTGNFSLEPGAMLLYGSPQGIKTIGTGTLDGNIRVSGSRNFSSQASYGFIGNGDMVSGDGLPGTVANLLVAKTSSGVTLSKTVNVAEVFTLKSGTFKTDSYELSILRQDVNALQLADPSFYIQGTVRRAVGTSGTYSFPVGNAAGKRQLEIMSIGLSGNGFQSLVVGFKPLSNHQDDEMAVIEGGYSYTHIATEGVWNVEPNTTPASGTFTAIASLQGFTNLEDNKFALLTRPINSTSGSDWQTGGGTLDAPDKEGRTVAGGYAKRNFITPFGQLGIATLEPVTVLPVSWLSFTGERKGQEVTLHWSTATELNNERFDIESSADGKQFSAIGKVPGSGNSNIIKRYQFQHLSEATTTIYYRLKQVDLDGKIEYSKVIAVKPGTRLQTQLVAYPNPAQDYLYLTNFKTDSASSLEVLDMKGKRMTLPLPALHGNSQVLEIKHLPAGNYLLQVKSSEGIQQHRFLKL